MRGSPISRLLMLNNYLNKRIADCGTSTSFRNRRGPRIPCPLGFKNFLNNRISRLRNSQIRVNFVSPGYLCLKII